MTDHTKTPDISYSIHEQPVHNDGSLGACICDGYDREKVIEEARQYYEDRAIDNDEYGDGDRTVILLTLDETGWEDGADPKETEEEITLEWSVEDDGYDGGRFDYLAGIGAVRSC